MKKVFKPYAPKQIMLLPPSLEEMIPEHHPVRLVNRIIDQIDLSVLKKQYQGGGASSYHPRMLLKVVVYAYLCNIYSSRRMEASVKENIHFMWLAGMSQPDHNTINRFRSDRLRDVLKEIFSQVVLLLVDNGLINLKQVYLDGTKIEANANRFTFVWGRAINTSRQRIKNQLEELWHYAQQVAQEELADTEPTCFEAIDPASVQQTIHRIDTALKDKQIDPKVKQKLNYAKKNWPGNLERYKQQKDILGDRNSFSKTDSDATFMRMKEDYMNRGQLKAGYNIQFTTQNQVIVNYTLHQAVTDTTTLAPHMDSFFQLYEAMPEVLTADAGYGSEENYRYLEDNAIEAFVKYNYFHREQKEKYAGNAFGQENLYYNEQQDCFYCPMGQKMEKVHEYIQATDHGYEQTLMKYQAQNCQGCPLRCVCHRQKGNRTIEINHPLRKYRAQARERLLSEAGLIHRKKRPADVEAVIGNIKYNKNFRRFMLRGLKKVEIEMGLLAIAHNMAKMMN